MMEFYVSELRNAVEKATPLLESISEEASREKPGPRKWCPREVLGHLIDSASNNHARFVRALQQDSLIFPGYDQDAWVEAQRYRETPWRELITFWRSFNFHIARVMEAAPESARRKARPDHNLDQIAWKTVPRTTPTTLDYLMEDYVGHLKHHLNQLADFSGRKR
ncbi:MAG TPA: DinB family protein [Gemmatimonadaceae bacterium]|nr:DinB family protein [Gemmatimonadaceae bacterium]